MSAPPAPGHGQNDLTFRTVPLWGGAAKVSIPDNFADVSDIRQVPSHQEVFLDKDGFTSIVIELLERIPIPDEEALQEHLEEICREGEVEVVSTGNAVMGKFAEGTPAYTQLISAPPSENERHNRPDFIAILLLLVRLERASTDLVVTVNVPHIPGQEDFESGSVRLTEGVLGPLVERGMRVREEVIRTLEMRDWGLFGG